MILHVAYSHQSSWHSRRRFRWSHTTSVPLYTQGRATWLSTSDVPSVGTWGGRRWGAPAIAIGQDAVLETWMNTWVSTCWALCVEQLKISIGTWFGISTDLYQLVRICYLEVRSAKLFNENGLLYQAKSLVCCGVRG